MKHHQNGWLHTIIHTYLKRKGFKIGSVRLKISAVFCLKVGNGKSEWVTLTHSYDKYPPQNYNKKHNIYHVKQDSDIRSGSNEVCSAHILVIYCAWKRRNHHHPNAHCNSKHPKWISA